jgi:hypothetical protein
MEVLGPGDIVDPWTPHALRSIAGEVRWCVHAEAVVAILDVRFAIAARRWPSLGVVARQKVCQRADRLAADCAICNSLG